MRCTRRRSDRSESVRRRHVSQPEALESRLVLSSGLPSYLSPWLPSDLPVQNPITHQTKPPDRPSLNPTIPTARSTPTRGRSSRARIGPATCGPSPSTARAR